MKLFLIFAPLYIVLTSLGFYLSFRTLNSSLISMFPYFQDEYVKAYYAALLMRQREQEETMNRPELANTISNEDYDTTTERQVGMKSKRDEDYEGDDVNWEEAAPPTGNSLFLSIYHLLRPKTGIQKNSHHLYKNQKITIGS